MASDTEGDSSSPGWWSIDNRHLTGRTADFYDDEATWKEGLAITDPAVAKQYAKAHGYNAFEISESRGCCMYMLDFSVTPADLQETDYDNELHIFNAPIQSTTRCPPRLSCSCNREILSTDIVYCSGKGDTCLRSSHLQCTDLKDLSPAELEDATWYCDECYAANKPPSRAPTQDFDLRLVHWSYCNGRPFKVICGTFADVLPDGVDFTIEEIWEKLRGVIVGTADARAAARQQIYVELNKKEIKQLAAVLELRKTDFPTIWKKLVE